jgi:hypothetical protein
MDYKYRIIVNYGIKIADIKGEILCNSNYICNENHTSPYNVIIPMIFYEIK